MYPSLSLSCFFSSIDRVDMIMLILLQGSWSTLICSASIKSRLALLLLFRTRVDEGNSRADIATDSRRSGRRMGGIIL